MPLTSLPLLPLFLPSVGIPELVILFIIVLILFGPGKLPSVAKAIGDGIRQFKSASQGQEGSPDAKTSKAKASQNNPDSPDAKASSADASDSSTV